MSKLRNILAVVVLLSTVSCAVDDIDAPSHGIGSSDKVTVIGRMTRFDEKDVTTRGVKNENEAKMTSMAMAIFPVVNNNSLGECIYYSYEDNEAELLFTITRSEMPIVQKEPYAMYIFCNMPGLEDYEAKELSDIKLDDILNEYLDVKNINIPANGFPMIGSLGDYFSTAFDRDNQRFILSPIGSDGKLTVPTVAQPDGNGGWGNAEPQDILTIPMKAMFAKVNFTIEVRPDQTIEGGYSPQFTLENYTVNNVPSTVDYSYTSNDDSAVLTDSFGGVVSGNTVASGANKINFTFYLPERLLTADKSLNSVLPANLQNKGAGFYDISVDADQNGYRDEDEVYHQRFKSKMLGDNQKATNIVLSGEFRDHQNHYWDVKYTIFLGENNSSDFNIKRNSEYNNFVTIRGIQASSDMSDNQNGIAIDHRVNVTRTQPAIISLRREVMLDSHFEVRPLRIRQSPQVVDGINAVKVEVVNPNTTNWMRIERSAGEGSAYAGKTNARGESIYITDEGPSKGKRRYFTYNLVDGKTPGTYDYSLVNSTSVILPLTNETECCWIYVDECTEVGDEVRAGIVKVSYGNYNGTDFIPTNNADYPSVNYVINQRKLFEVKYDDPKTTEDENRKYHIEYEEEYLHNFDADDNYGETEYEGMQWGLNGIQLSYKENGHISYVSQTGTWTDGFKDNYIEPYAPYFDFYTKKHDSKVMPNEEHLHDRNGYLFCVEIIQEVNGDTNHDSDNTNDIDVLTLSQKPKSAIEYCFNKNKRDSEGHVVWQNAGNTYNTSQLNWYLPAIDEMEDIVMSKYGNGSYAYSRFIDFQNKFYWGSQPAFYKNHFHYSVAAIGTALSQNDWGWFYTDNVYRARATRVGYDGEFYYETSGTDGYYSILLIDGSMVRNWSEQYFLYEEITDSNPTFRYQYDPSVNLWGNKDYSNAPYSQTYTKDDFPIFDSGNLPRTSYARVRCVRYVPPVQQ